MDLAFGPNFGKECFIGKTLNKKLGIAQGNLLLGDLIEI